MLPQAIFVINIRAVVDSHMQSIREPIQSNIFPSTSLFMH